MLNEAIMHAFPAAVGCRVLAPYGSIPPFLASLACFVGVLASPTRNALAAENVPDQVTQIFAAVDGASDKRSTPDAAYARLQKVKPGETDSAPAHYAYMLGLVELHKQRDAVAYAEELFRHNPYDARCRLLRARLMLREKKFSQVFADLETAGRSLAERTKKTTLDAETEASCRALGLMFGYLEGPAKPLVKATLGSGIKDRLMADLSSAAKQVFDEQYNAVQEEYQELIDKGEAAFHELQAKHREDSEKVSEKVVERRATLEKQKSEVEYQKQQLTKKWDSAKSVYDRLAAVYLNSRTARAQLINQRTLLASQAAAAMPREPKKDKNGNISNAQQQQYNREQWRYDQLVNQVNLADQRILQGAASLQQLWNQGAIAEANLVRLQAEGNRLGIEFALKERAFAKQEAQLNRTEPKMKKLPSAASKHLEQTFAQYDDFNYPQEKQRLLDSLRPAK